MKFGMAKIVKIIYFAAVMVKTGRANARNIQRSKSRPNRFGGFNRRLKPPPEFFEAFNRRLKRSPDFFEDFNRRLKRPPDFFEGFNRRLTLCTRHILLGGTSPVLRSMAFGRD
jgi:hypothetical protein